MTGRGACFSDEPFWKGTVFDEPSGRSELDERILKNPDGENDENEGG